jgi:radical SAM superfamily enzyme YgiQ (UPF0313 family)
MPRLEYFSDIPPLGLGYIASMLDYKGIPYEVLDLNLGYSSLDLINRIKDFSPDLVGVAGPYIFQHRLLYDLINLITKEGYDTVIGGPLVSTFRSSVLKSCDATYAVKFEGEYTLLELCEEKPIEGIRGLVYRKNGRVIENEDRVKLQNLDEIPFPKYKGFELEKYPRKAFAIVSSKGCPYNCNFCQFKILSGRKFRARSAENVVEELRYWYNKGYRSFEFYDDNLLVDKQRISKICNLIQKFRLTELLLVAGYVRVDHIDEAIIKEMKQSGFTQISLGAESGSDRVLMSMNKGQTVSQIKEAVKLLCDSGLKVVLDTTLGHPRERMSDVWETIKLVLKYPIYKVYTHNLVPLPGTELYDWVKNNNYFKVPPDIYTSYSVERIKAVPVFATPEFSYVQRKKALRLFKFIALYVEFRYRLRLKLVCLFNLLNLSILQNKRVK